MSALGAEALTAQLRGSQYGPEEPQDVEYSYWPVNYRFGDPTVISSAPFPLSGVQFSVLARGVGELRATLQVVDPEVRAMGPFDKFIQRKTGIVVVRKVTSPQGIVSYTIPFHGVLWSNPTNPATGRMELLFQTVESTWARRKITGAPPIAMVDSLGIPLPDVTWSQADQSQIVRDLLNPGFFSQFGNIGGQWPGWINIEGPSNNTGVLRDMTYPRGSETNLLTAHQDRSKIIGGYEWYTTQRVLSGQDAYSAISFRCQYVLGYPRLGRQYNNGDDIPRFSYYVDGRGNVANVTYANTGESVYSIIWGTGSGTADAAVRVVSSFDKDWQNGFLITENSYSNPDVKDGATLQQQTNTQLIQGYANQQYVASLTVRGDLFPTFDTYAIGDDCLFTTDDYTWPDNADGSRGVTFISRIMGWTVTPSEADHSETIAILIAGQDSVDG